MSGRAPVDSTAEDAIAITPSDTTVYQPALRGLYIGAVSSGTLTVVTAGGNTVEFNPPVAGSTIPLACSQVKATGTTGVTGIIGLR